MKQNLGKISTAENLIRTEPKTEFQLFQCIELHGENGLTLLNATFVHSDRDLIMN